MHQCKVNASHVRVGVRVRVRIGVRVRIRARVRISNVLMNLPAFARRLGS